MTDLSRLIDDLCAGLEGPGTPALSTFAETLSTAELPQTIDNTSAFHSFQSFHSEIGHHGISQAEASKHADFDPAGSRVTSSYAKELETAERVESDGKSLAGSTSSLFPLSLGEVERVEMEGGACERPLLDLNRAAPQRSDWWTGGLMAEVDRLAPPLGASLPISPSEVRAGVARELRALDDLGRTGPDALRDAVEITAAKIWNSEVLAERQANGSRCHVCNGSLNDGMPVVAVLTGKRGAHLHMHDTCHAEHKAHRTALVDKIMAAAGYGWAQADGDAA